MMKQNGMPGRDLSKALTSEDLLGKDVIDYDSTIIGVVEKVLIDPKTLDFVGISIDRGFIRKGVTIGRDYIDEIKEHAVFLKIRMSYEVKGKIVFDSLGRVVGRVYSLELYENMNKIVSLIVRKSLLFGGKEILIPSKYVRAIGENVMLSVRKEELR